MNENILKSIIKSSSLADKSASSDDWQSINENENFPVVKPNLNEKLSSTFTKLLSYKVSREAYQRYSVRLNVIDTLRDWTRIKGSVGKVLPHQELKKSSDLLLSIMKKYASEEVIESCDDVDNLVQMAEVLLNSTTDRSSMRCFENVIKRIIDLEQTEKSQAFLKYIFHKSDNLKLSSILVESIYTTQKCWLIEKPFNDCFMSCCTDEKQNFEQKLREFDFLFEKISCDPSLFQLLSEQMRSMFVITKYAEKTQNFIKNVLKQIDLHCSKYSKDTLDLYPINLQFCVILLRIKPENHSSDSKSHTVNSLKQIFLKNHDDALVLVSHFPDWLPEYEKFFHIIETPVQKAL
ncbi:hypothetical protein TKK_0014956 [Trichogramma kaykai]|uniref:Uncharacterized protein n=1 Tax=Trichogramma kaykai TaxID=54128 RepID=A0ABD2WBR6_9HYME